MANYMEQVAQMLGVKLGEEFKRKDIKCCYISENIYKITNDGLLVFGDYGWEENVYVLASLLCGDDEIIKLPKPILTDKEKEYLGAVIKPFRKRIEFIAKYELKEEKEYIDISLDYDMIDLPIFKKGTMYKGMEVGKRYTLEDLGV